MTRVTRGLAATIALLALLIGIPAGLWMLSGNPIPSTFDLAQIQASLTSPDQGQLVLTVLAWVGWIAWATFALSVIVEIPAQLSGARTPRLPGLGMQQRGAHLLVAAVVAMLSIGGPALTQSATAATTTATTSTSSTATTSKASAAAPATPSAAKATTTSTTQTGSTSTIATGRPDRIVVVKPGDTLWDLAKKTTGSGEHYKDLANASRHTIQSDGRHLTNPADIYAGWKITVPGALATPAGDPPAKTTPKASPAVPPSSTATTPSPVQPGTQPTPQTGGSTATPQSAAPSTARPPASYPSPGAARAGGGTAIPVSGASNTDPTSTTSEDSSNWTAVTTTGRAGTAAAGVVVLLNRRRGAQSRRRKPGRRIAMPEPVVAVTEAAIREDADPLAAADLDLAMRTLAAVTHSRDQRLPDLRAARITPTSLELYLVDDGIELPAPFTQISGGVWQVHRSGIPNLLDADDAQATAAPYPCLVTLGQDEENAWVLINLEEVKALALTGTDHTYVEQVLAAMTLELIGSEWADDLRVTLVDVMEDAADALGSDRVTHVHDLDHVLTSLEYLADANTAALTDVGVDGVAQARATGDVPDTWTPHLLVLAGPPTAQQRDRITAILDRVPRLAIAALTAGDDPLAECVLTLTTATTGDDTAEARGSGWLSPFELEVTPQYLDTATYDQLISTFRTTDEDDVPGPVWAVGISDEPTLDELPEPATALVDDAHEVDPVDEQQDKDVDDAPITTGGDPVGEFEESSTAEEQILAAVAEHDATHPGITHLTLPTQGPMLRLLGDVQVEGATGKRPQAPRRATELIAFLALHPSDSYEPLDAALWPNQRVTATKRNGPVNQARTWLGTADDGHPYVAMVAEHGYRLAPDTACDWNLLRDLLADDISTVSTPDLRKALTLVAGQPLTVTGGRGTWAWAEADRQEMIATVADVAHELATRALTTGDSTLAAWAAAKGLTAEPASEQLWRDQLRAAYLSAIPGRVTQVAQHLTDTLEPLAGDLEPETVELLDELLGRQHRKVS